MILVSGSGAGQAGERQHVRPEDCQTTPACKRDLDIDQFDASRAALWLHPSANHEEPPRTTWPHLPAYFSGGVSLANATPHIVSGMPGRPFQTPFARPSGEGLCSSTVNVLRGLFNLGVGYAPVGRVGIFAWKVTGDARALGAGILLLALFSARHCGRLHGGNAPGQP